MVVSRKLISVFVIVAIVGTVMIVSWSISQSQSNLSQVEDSTNALYNDLYIVDMEFNGIRTVCISNESHLFFYDIYYNNITQIVQIPADAICSINDMTLLYEMAIVAVDEGTGGLVIVRKSGELYNFTIPGMDADAKYISVASDSRRNSFYVGSVEYGILIWNRDSYTLSNISTIDGLLSNHVTKLKVRSGRMIAACGLGINIIDLDTYRIWNVTNLPESTIFCMEYSPATDELYIGSDSGLHLCKYLDEEWKYVRTLGPSDGLPHHSIKDLELDPTSHKMIILTGTGICTSDLYDYEISLLEDTTSGVHIPTVLYHIYYGPKCYIYYGTSNDGLWELVIDYSYSEPEDLTSLLRDVVLISVGAGLTIFGSVAVSEYERYRDKKEKKES